MKPAPFEYHAARSAAEAVEVLARHGDAAKVLAGGQSLVPMLNLRLARPGVLVDINGAADLDYLREADGVLAVGALVRQRRLERWAADRAPLIAEALRLVGHVAIRNRGTAVGNLAHGDPASELPALLLCLDGAVVARRTGGERLIAAAELYLAPLTTVARRGRDPRRGALHAAARGRGLGLRGGRATPRRLRPRRLRGAPVAGRARGASPARDSASSVSGRRRCAAAPAKACSLGLEPTPARLREAAQAAAAALSPDGDLHATADYRRRVAGVLAERTLIAALERCGSRA